MKRKISDLKKRLRASEQSRSVAARRSNAALNERVGGDVLQGDDGSDASSSDYREGEVCRDGLCRDKLKFLTAVAHDSPVQLYEDGLGRLRSS